MIFDLFKRKKTEEAVPQVPQQSDSSSPQKKSDIDSIIEFIVGNINRRDLISGVIRRYGETKGMTQVEHDISCMPVYFALEDFVTKNKPLVVIKEYTKAELRSDISKNFDISSLQIPLRLVFLPEGEKWFYFFKEGTDQLSDSVIKHLGENRLKQIVSTLKVMQAPDLNTLYEEVKKKDITTIKEVFAELYKSLFELTSSVWDVTTAEKILQQRYFFVASHYPDEFIAQFLQILPEGALKEERLRYLSRGQLQDKVKERTRELEEETSRLQSALENMTLGVIISDTSRQILSINPIARLLLGVSPTTEKQTLNDVLSFPLDVKTLILQKVDEAISLGKTNKMQEVTHGARIFQLFMSPVINRENKLVIGSVVVLQDITEEKLVDRAKDELFTIASHELRTPLTIVHGYATMLEDLLKKKFPDTLVLDMVQNIDVSSQGLIRIVNDFLDVSRLEQGKVMFTKEKFSVLGLVHEVVSSTQALAVKKNITVKLDYSGSADFIGYADKGRTSQCLLNLVGNAIKFTSQGGVTLSLEQKDSHILIRVVDTGPGIDPKRQNLLFRKFQQAGESLITRDASNGTGLGLYISKLIMGLMGGAVYLEKSVPGKGSTFVLSIPVVSS